MYIRVMAMLSDDLGGRSNREVIEAVVDDIRENILSTDGSIMGFSNSDPLYAEIKDNFTKCYRLLSCSLDVWGDIDESSRVNLARKAQTLISLISDFRESRNSELAAPRSIDKFAKLLAHITSRDYVPLVRTVASLKFMTYGSLGAEDALATQDRLDRMFNEFVQRTDENVEAQVSKLVVALKEVVTKKVSEQTLQEIDKATRSMLCKAICSVIGAIAFAAGAIAFVLCYPENNVDGSYQLAASITRRVTILSIGFVAIGILIRLFRSYVSSIESLKHKRRLIQSFQELLVMGGTENSEHVFSNLIAILVRPDFSMNPSEKASEVDVATVSSAVAQVLKSSGKS